MMRKVSADNCCGVVLAGGRSLRMGDDKASLLFQGEPLLARMLRLLQLAGLNQVMVSGNYPDYPHLPDSPDANGELTAQGPLAGLLSMAQHLRGQSEYLMVIPVDMPLLPRGAIENAMTPPADIPAVAYENSYFPLRLTLDDHLIDQLQCLLDLTERKAHSIRALLERLPTRWLPLPEHSELFCNVNTPAQWQQALLDSQEER